MFADLLLIIVCLGIALYGAWETVQIRHHHATAHKRRQSDR